MTPFVFVVILCVSIITFCNAELNCANNEVENSCPSACDLDFCPKNEIYKTRSCEKPTKCEPACKCRFNNLRADNGTCISTRKCPAFPCTRPNEEYVSCPPFCPTDDCSQATPSGGCLLDGLTLLVAECRPACRCKQGFWRNKGTCVLYAECPKRQTQEESAVSPLIWMLG